MVAVTTTSDRKLARGICHCCKICAQMPAKAPNVSIMIDGLVDDTEFESVKENLQNRFPSEPIVESAKRELECCQEMLGSVGVQLSKPMEGNGFRTTEKRTEPIVVRYNALWSAEFEIVIFSADLS